VPVRKGSFLSSLLQSESVHVVQPATKLLRRVCGK
jgi:hypothetical protein